jgi:hypothetical protein
MPIDRQAGVWDTRRADKAGRLAAPPRSPRAR